MWVNKTHLKRLNQLGSTLRIPRNLELGMLVTRWFLLQQHQLRLQSLRLLRSLMLRRKMNLLRRLLERLHLYLRIEEVIVLVIVLLFSKVSMGFLVVPDMRNIILVLDNLMDLHRL